MKFVDTDKQALPRQEQFFLALITIALAALIAAFVFAHSRD